MILAVGLVTAVIVSDIGDGRQRIGVVQLVGGTVDKAVALDEGKLLGIRTVDVDTVQTGRIVAASGIELSILACIQSRRRKEVGDGVDFGRLNIAEFPVYPPDVYALGNLLVFMGTVVVVRIEVTVIAFITLCDVAHFIYLVIFLGSDCQQHGDEHQQREYVSLHPKALLFLMTIQ